MQVKSINQIKFVSTPNFRAQGQELPTAEDVKSQNISMKGSEALANYNALLINPKKSFEVEPNELIYTPEMNIEGEKIYSSDGKLKAIVKDEENTKTTYYVNDEKEDLVDKVEVYDKKAGDIIARQYNDGEYADIGKFENGKLVSSSSYKDGELISGTKYEYKEDGSSKSLRHYLDDKSYVIDFENEKTKSYKSFRLDENARFINFYEHKEDKNKEFDVEARLYNGGIYSLTKSESMTMPTLLGHDKLDDTNLVPAKKVEIYELIKLQDSQKSFYSNGNLEKCVDENKTINFDLDGKVVSITEKLDNGEEKTTNFSKYDDTKQVVIMSDNNKYKEINYNEKGIPRSYYEGTKQDDDIERSLSLYFNKQGMLTGAYGN